MNDSNKNSLLAEGAQTIILRLRTAGFQALFAGGCVRDIILGREPKDFDVVTDAPPEKVLELFPRAVPVGKAFGVVRVGINAGPPGARLGEALPPSRHGKAPLRRDDGRRSLVALAQKGPSSARACQDSARDNYYDVATYRKDGAYSDGRHPQSVAFADEQTDAARRDFTINAMFFDPIEGKIHDHVGGKEDLDKKIIRAVGNPDQRFQDDHLRMLRAVRFAATLNFAIEPQTADSIKRHASLIGRVSAERIQQELSRILLESAQPGSALEMLSSFGLLKEILPEAEAMRGQEQPPQFHPEGDVWRHTIMMLNAMNGPSLRLAYAVLLHDIGKPGTALKAPDRIRFNRHAEFGAAIAVVILQRLRLPSADIKAISHIIGNHMRFMDVRRMRKSTLRRLITADTFPDELELHRLDCVASHGDMQNYFFLVDFEKGFEAEPVLPEPLINGGDIIALGVSPGPLVGQLKKAAYDAQLEGKFDGRDAALKWLKNEFGKGHKLL